MREIHQIVDEQTVIEFAAKARIASVPALLVRERKIEGRLTIRQSRIASPDMDEALFFDDRIGPNASTRRYPRLTRYTDTGAGLVIDKTVIAALQMIADHLAQRQGRLAMNAAILQRNRHALGVAIEHHRLIQQNSRQRCIGYLGRKRRDIPTVAQEGGRMCGHLFVSGCRPCQIK